MYQSLYQVCCEPQLTINCVFRVLTDLVLRGVSNQPTSVSVCHNRRSHAIALAVRNDLQISVAKHSNARVDCSQVDSNSASHLKVFVFLFENVSDDIKLPLELLKELTSLNCSIKP
jgi:NAD-specific glutamate dehydrogenase